MFTTFVYTLLLKLQPDLCTFEHSSQMQPYLYILNVTLRCNLTFALLNCPQMQPNLCTFEHCSEMQPDLCTFEHIYSMTFVLLNTALRSVWTFWGMPYMCVLVKVTECRRWRYWKCEYCLMPVAMAINKNCNLQPVMKEIKPSAHCCEHVMHCSTFTVAACTTHSIEWVLCMGMLSHAHR